MSDGGNKESGKDHHEQEAKKNNNNKSRSGGGGGGGGEFGLAIARIAVAQICEEVGFQSFQHSALEALTDVAVRYLHELGKASHFYADLAGRTDCNVFDIIQGLEDLGFAQGFTGSSEINRCVVASGAAKEITRFVNLTDEIPLARPVPRFPVIRNRKPIRSFLQIGEDPVGKHIPPWLPAFPDPQTYVRTSMCNERESDLCTEKFEQVKQHNKKADWSLLNLQQRLLCNGSAASTSVDPGDAAKLKRAADSNPFLAPPLQSADKEQVSPAFPAKLSNETVKEKRVSVLETFAPVIEAAKSGLCNTGIVEKKILPSKRPTVQFKLGTGKKSLDMPLEFSLQKKAVGKKDLSLGRDDEKDEWKRRAEQILKGSMENPEEFV